MNKYEMDPTRTVGATEQTRNAGQTDRQMDGWTRWNQYTPKQLRCVGGITIQSRPNKVCRYHMTKIISGDNSVTKASWSMSRTHVLTMTQRGLSWRYQKALPLLILMKAGYINFEELYRLQKHIHLAFIYLGQSWHWLGLSPTQCQALS